MSFRVSDPMLAQVEREIRRQADENYERLDYEALLTIAPYGRRQLERTFRERYLTSPQRYFRDVQWECARQLLLEGQDVLSVSLRAGFASPGRLHDAVIARSGMTPGEMRRRGEGVHIDAGFFQTQIGVILIAATTRGLTWLRICGANPTADALDAEFAELRATLTNANIIEAPEAIKHYADQLVAYLEARTGAEFCPPLDILAGTTFQREVWQELQHLPPGETVTIPELAARMGRPDATAEITEAVEATHLAIVIPTHRTVLADGTLGNYDTHSNYKWNAAWHERLIQIEAERNAEQRTRSRRVKAAGDASFVAGTAP
jgi:AraC family transcriptional regulator, regulatory protein of adaptative response / methylated-DNA-[protein]-cysteine methyltransferase